MLDPWDELETLQKGRRDSLACSRDLETIRNSCVREHNKPHVVECAECWPRLINRLRDRYLNSAIKEWFSGRRAFLQELDDLFTKARQHEVDFQTIEQKIADEKKEWLRDKVRNLNLQPAARTQFDARILQQRLNDRDIPADQLVSGLRDCLGVDPKLWDEVANRFLKHVKAGQPPTARAHAYMDVLFEPESKASDTTKSQKYIDMMTSGKPMVEVINAMSRDRQTAKGELDQQKQQLQKKLEELRRAKAAHELDKSKRDQARQEKARAALSSIEDRVPGCSVCQGIVGTEEFLACPLCQMLASQFKVLKEPTLFCSNNCFEKGYDSHVNSSHECWSAQTCVSLADVDVDMGGDEPLIVFCRECVEHLGLPSTFCSSRCYRAHFQRHRENVHIPERQKRERDIDDRDQLAIDSDDETRYSVKNVGEHIIRLRDAMATWQETTGAIVW
ncbi:hypothetical protein F4777DRAFT_64566 [Nemania sp. FL0916]|nr:hypothetical protein F4777DRAFT_64566 [Nemania sp. FL0916]